MYEGKWSAASRARGNKSVDMNHWRAVSEIHFTPGQGVKYRAWQND